MNGIDRSYFDFQNKNALHSKCVQGVLF